jgi:hypothetical protein
MKAYTNFNKALIIFNIYYVTFFYYLYNIGNKLIIVSTILFFILINISSTIKIIKYFFLKITKIDNYLSLSFVSILMIMSILALDILTYLGTTDLEKNLISKDYFSLSGSFQFLQSIRHELIIILSMYLIFFIKINILYKKFINAVIINSFYLCLVFYTAGIIDLLYEFTYASKNINFGRPLISLSFLGDYFSSKLQYALIYLLTFAHYIFDYLDKKNSFTKNIIIGYSIFLIFLINSKLFYCLFFIICCVFFIANYNKKKLNKTLQVLFFALLFLILSQILINNTKLFQKNSYKFSIIDNVSVKFYYEINFISDSFFNLNYFETNDVLNFLKISRNNNNTKEVLYFVNSTSQRNEIKKKCLAKNTFINNRFDSWIVDSSSLNSNIPIILNCEGTIFQYIYKYGLFIIIIFSILYLSIISEAILLRRKFLILMSILLLLLVFHHQLFFNPVFCLLFVSSYCLDNYETG